MTYRVHSLLISWTLLFIGAVSAVLAFFLTFAQLALIMLISVSVALIFGYLVRLFVSRPLSEIAMAARRLAAGDLQQRLPISGNEEIAALGNSLNTMAENLSARMKELSEGKQRLELIVGAMSEGIMVLDRSGRVTLTNRAARQALAMDRDPVGRTPLEMLRRPELDKVVRNVLSGGPSETIEFVAGNGRILQANVAPVLNASE